MTTVTLKSKSHGSELRVNGRLVCFPRQIESVEKKGSRFVGKARGSDFEVLGGVEGGGSRTDWFVSWDLLGVGLIPCSSAAEAFKLIENS